MKSATKAFVKNQAGMTLVEILIVLAIIGGLMAIIAPNIFDNLDKSKVRETKIIMGQVSQALAMYQSDCSKLPATLDGLMKDDGGCTSWGPTPYMKKSPADAWGRPFVYTPSDSTFELKSLGKDGKEGGDAFGKDLVYEEGG